MKLNIFENTPVDLPSSGEWIFIQSATGDIDITFNTIGNTRTITIGQGEMLKMPFDGLQFKARESDQEIEFRMGWGTYTPNITAVTSTIIDQIKKPVLVSNISAAVNVQKIIESVTVDSITNPVTVGSITDPVTVDSITNPVTVGSITDPVTVSDNHTSSFLSVDLTISANSFIDVSARDRAQIIFQNMSESTTYCRVSDVSEVGAVGLWLIGGGGLFGESPILKTNAALRVWNTSDSDALITIAEVF